MTVSDDGAGIAPELLPRLFERFHRVEGAQGRSIEGSGIGLALVQELVRLHGGSVRVESEQGLGTTLTVQLPFGKKHLPDDQIRKSQSQVPIEVRAQSYLLEAASWLSETSSVEATSPHGDDYQQPAAGGGTMDA